jgi:adenylate kinase
VTQALRRICLVGVRGVGKTTLIRAVLSQVPDVDYVVGSAVLRELAGPDFERFDHLPPVEKQRYREEAIAWMEARQARVGKHVLCDGHTALLDESTGRVAPVFTERDCGFFRELALLEAPAEVVLARRAGDPSKRRSLDLAIIRDELEGERRACEALAAAWSMTLHRLPAGTDPRLRAGLLEVLRT